MFLRGEHMPVDFLTRGGKMGSLVRSFPWTATKLGSVDQWPQSLQAAVRVCLESRQPAVIHWGLDLLSIYNDAFVPILGDDHLILLGNSANLFPDLWHTVGEIVSGVFETGKPEWHEDLMFILERRRQQNECHMQGSFSPITDDSGEIGGVCCLYTETTARVISERQLQVQVQLATRLADAVNPIEVCRAAADSLREDSHDITFACFYLFNEHEKQWRLSGSAGIEPGTAGSPYAMPMESSGLSPIAKAVRTGRKQVVDAEEMSGCFPCGAWRISPHSIAVLPLNPGRASQRGVMIAGLNPYRKVDEGYRAFLDQFASSVANSIAGVSNYLEQRKRVDVLSDLDRAKTEFFTTVSHEFRTPLTLMLEPVEKMLQHPEEAAHQKEDMQIVHRNALRLLKLVNSLLDFSRIESGRAKALYEPTELGSFTAELAKGFQSAIENARLRFTVNCPVLYEPVYVDREMWEKLVLNLLSNALKCTVHGGIGISIRQTDRNVELSVWDTGAGIGMADAEGRTAEGTGIGFALVKEVAKFHGGAVSLDSTPGEGSQIRVSILLGTAHLPPQHVGGTRRRCSNTKPAEVFAREVQSIAGDPSSTAACTHQPAPAKSRGCILVVEDHADMRNYVQRLLSKHYEVYAVSGGDQALTLLRGVRPDLVLTDVMMPQVSGISLLRAIRLNPATKKLPVILLSGEVAEESRVQGLETGANDYVVKPFSARELRARVAVQVKLGRVNSASA